jgi:hypothetical protein
VDELEPEIPDCEAAMRQLPAFLRGELDAMNSGLIDGHLYLCDQCAQAFGLLVAETRVANAAVGRAAPVRESVRRAGSGLSWHRHRNSSAELLRPLLMRSIAAGARVRGQRLGEGAAQTVSVQVVDSSWSSSGIEIAAWVTSPPRFDAHGDFRVLLALSAEDAEHYRGSTLACLLRLEGGACISFEAPVEGVDVSLSAEGLLSDCEAALIPLSWLEFFLSPSPSPLAD